MNVYMIYAIMSDNDLKLADRYGQYDIFRLGKRFDDRVAVLWGFTDSKKIKNRFLTERPVKNRYLIKKMEMSESEYSTFMMDNFRYELLPAFLDTRQNIGAKTGYMLSDPCMKTKVSNEDLDNYTNKVITKYEYDYITNNAGEICTYMEYALFSKIKLPLDITVFTFPVRVLLELTNYQMYSYMYSSGISAEKIHTLTGDREVHPYDIFSIADLFYYVFAEMIYREVIE